MMIKAFVERRCGPTEVAVACVAVVGIATSIKTVPGAGGLLGAGLALVMLAIAIIDSYRFIIPDELNAAGLALAIADAAITSDAAVAAVEFALLRASIFALAFWGFRFGYRRMRGRNGLGLGDVKLAAVAGAWLDWPAMPIALEGACVSALALHVASQAISGHEIRGTNRLPFGLFFAPAIWLAWLAQSLWLTPG